LIPWPGVIARSTAVCWPGLLVAQFPAPPFGGWVYWTRIAPEDLGVVEVSRGASTSVFGDLAMGGAISLFSRPQSPIHAELGIESGAESTNETHGSLASIWGRSSSEAPSCICCDRPSEGAVGGDERGCVCAAKASFASPKSGPAKARAGFEPAPRRRSKR